jgi:hypothetical protein
MPPARCSCGFTEDAVEDYTISDHLYETMPLTLAALG